LAEDLALLSLDRERLDELLVGNETEFNEHLSEGRGGLALQATIERRQKVVIAQELGVLLQPAYRVTDHSTLID
jgi:hypothetical protein